MMMWRIAQASVLLGSGSARPACETRQMAAPPRNHPAWANRSDRPVLAGRGDSGVIAARDDGGARPDSIRFRGAVQAGNDPVRDQDAGLQLPGLSRAPAPGESPVRMTTMAPRA